MSYNRVPSSVTVKPKKSSVLSILLGFFVLITIGAAGFIGYKNYTLDKDLETVKSSIQATDAKIAILETKQKVGAVYEAKELLAKAQAIQVKWSEVYRDVYQYVENQPNIDIKTLSSSGDKIVVSASSDGFASVSGLLNNLLFDKDATKVIKNPFVASISGSNDFGETYDFNLTFDYVKAPNNLITK